MVAAAALVVSSPAPTAAESNGGLRIMPLGDSITAGVNVPGGYRTSLWRRAAADHRKDDFVGSRFNGPIALGDHDHEGHPGWRIDGIDARAAVWTRAARPRTVLLHIGTNDMLRNHDVRRAPARLSTLIGRLTAAAPGADVFVSDLVPIGNRAAEARAKTFNAAVPGVVRKWVQRGRHVHFVAMHSALRRQDLPDGVHPSAGGYAKMAARWYAKLRTGPWI
ncbi:SGNH/GDSL hydrolase family protein [Streptomyces sp. H27-D2]|uniref:SGNH/GDSL hydrolase family protein n=1 Tax=Streptomyces sp. H27-D2 TaxID=3046304 RepID=UPI002DB8D4F7|nr:SGNH/GDSL hydrolase family protein [Streptomyces sp. H27-D2]MEC4020318.1 SGNH/GDSL hydrolase family protein [Streptomyces sp. H27-D2]